MVHTWLINAKLTVLNRICVVMKKPVFFGLKASLTPSLLLVCQRVPGPESVRGSVLLQAGLLRRVSGGAGCVPAERAGLHYCPEPQGLQPLQTLQWQGSRGTQNPGTNSLSIQIIQ